MAPDPFYSYLPHGRELNAAGEETFTGSPAALALVHHVFDHFPHRKRLSQAEMVSVPGVVPPALISVLEKDLSHRLHHALARERQTVLWVDPLRWYAVPGFGVDRGFIPAQVIDSWAEVPADFEYSTDFVPVAVLSAWVIPLFQPPQQKD